VTAEAKYIILLGAPGAGKGTQAELLHTQLGLVHVASGDLFRENVSKGTPLGQLAKTFMDKGELVPDDVTVRMVVERIARPDCVEGVVFDGFPRTEAQARALDAALAAQAKKISQVLLVDVQDQTLVDRLSARWLCPIDGLVYNTLTNPPSVPGRCDKDGGVLYQREDDKPETVRRRLVVYHTQTRPLIDYYRQSGLLVTVDGERNIEQVQTDLVKAVKEL
jgi:adenylate kinase